MVSGIGGVPHKIRVSVSVPPLVTLTTREDGDDLHLVIIANCPWRLGIDDDEVYGDHGTHRKVIPNLRQVLTIEAVR